MFLREYGPFRTEYSMSTYDDRVFPDQRDTGEGMLRELAVTKKISDYGRPGYHQILIEKEFPQGGTVSLSFNRLEPADFERVLTCASDSKNPSSFQKCQHIFNQNVPHSMSTN